MLDGTFWHIFVIVDREYVILLAVHFAKLPSDASRCHVILASWHVCEVELVAINIWDMFWIKIGSLMRHLGRNERAWMLGILYIELVLEVLINLHLHGIIFLKICDFRLLLCLLDQVSCYVIRIMQNDQHCQDYR